VSLYESKDVVLVREHGRQVVVTARSDRRHRLGIKPEVRRMEAGKQSGPSVMGIMRNGWEPMVTRGLAAQSGQKLPDCCENSLRLCLASTLGQRGEGP